MIDPKKKRSKLPSVAMRYTFGGRSYTDINDIKVALQMVAAVDDERHKERGDAARKGRAKRRKDAALDQRDDFVRKIVEEERQRSPGAYMKRALKRINEKDPKFTAANLKKLLKKK